MLLRLYIENIAVIERAELAFGPGFNVLTGETGAGKSMIIDSINMILGQKTSKDLVRRGASGAYVSALFADFSPGVLNSLAQLGIEPDEEGVVLIERELSESGRGTCRINGRPATAAALREAGESLINIHGQHDNQSLLQGEKHLGFLDRFAQDEEELAAYRASYHQAVELKKQLDAVCTDEAEKARKIDLYQYQINEIEGANLRPGEEEELLKQRDLLAHAQKISQAIDLCCAALYDGQEGEPSAFDQLGRAVKALSSVSHLDEQLTRSHDAVQNVLYQLEDIAATLRDKGGEIEDSAGMLNEIESRLALIARLKPKYGADVTAILAYYDQICQELTELNLSDKRRAELAAELEQAQGRLLAAGGRLSEKRKEAAKRLEEQVVLELSFLDMERVRFAVSFDGGEQKPGPNGLDRVEFLLAANPGEDLKPLTKTASGGELSRIMLALKNVLSDQDDVDTLIFDEVDTGISGRAASKVAQKLYAVSQNRQVLCVTHLTQIASFADQHFLIAKESDETSTKTRVEPLTQEQRVEELARIIGGPTVTELTKQNAREMLEVAAKMKVEE